MKYIAAISLLALGFVSAAPTPQSPLTFGLGDIGSSSNDGNGNTSSTDLTPSEADGSLVTPNSEFDVLDSFDNTFINPSGAPLAGARMIDSHANIDEAVVALDQVNGNTGLLGANSLQFNPFNGGDTLQFGTPPP